MLDKKEEEEGDAKQQNKKGVRRGSLVTRGGSKFMCSSRYPKDEIRVSWNEALGLVGFMVYGQARRYIDAMNASFKD